VAISQKCTELDRAMPEMLGVPKPVLEHVVFCHQEDSNWPLQEGAKLKERFDQIFESARYTKALDEIKKTRKVRRWSTWRWGAAHGSIAGTGGTPPSFPSATVLL
jgi:DNA repair exonuclease SbcCD ATPase subunit